ncbi:SGNH/GDSL hydrolase family protein [Mycoplasmopsis iners]|uniref:SGNH/GDSL hydrolase family protein n=1 Tax=Mycoplasmopsis iners TaxID=76630 RepID=UPI0004977C88|nr:SGNH/GDSL hydrolase family protein [Mycoplasmopsis iners]
MKIKLKTAIVLLSTTLIGTIGLGVGLSFIPTKEKSIEKGKDAPIQPGADYSNVPGLPSDDDNQPLNPGKEDDKNHLSILDEEKQLAKNAITKGEKVRYVAIGDSITAGFDATLPNDFQGELTAEGEVTGASYPAYFAALIQSAEANKLESFKNFARSGATMEHWNALFAHKYDHLEPKTLAKMHRLFGQDLDGYADLVIERLKTANLLTLSLGANDTIALLKKEIAKLPFAALIQQITNKKYNYGQIVEILNTTFQNVYDAIEQREVELINHLKAINPNLNINFVSYPLPMSFIGKLVDQYLKDNFNIPIAASQILIGLLNDKIKFVANANDANFVNVYNAPYWIPKVEKLAPSLFDIHPSIFGYKKMAMELFSKLILKTKNLAEVQSHGFEWGNEFFENDQTTYSRTIEFNEENPFNITDRLFGSNQTSYLFDQDALTAKVIGLKDISNYYNRVINETRFSNIVFGDLLLSLFKSKGYLKLDPEQKLFNFLTRNNEENLKSLQHWAEENLVFSGILRDAQTNFYETDWDNDGEPGAKEYKLNYLLESFKIAATNEFKIIQNITSFLSLPMFADDDKRNEFKEIVQEIIGNLIQKELADETINKLVGLFYNNEVAKYIDRDDLVRAISKIINNANLKTALGKVISSLIDAFPSFSEARSFNDLLNILLNNSGIKEALGTALNDLFIELLKDNEFKQIVARAVNKTFTTLGLNAEIDDQQLTKFAYEILNVALDLNNNLELLKVLFNGLALSISPESIRNFSLDTVMNNVVGKVKELFNEQNAENTIFTILKALLTNNLGDFKEEFKKIINNVFNSTSLGLKDKLARILAQLIQKATQSDVNVDELENTIKEIIESDSFKGVFDKLIDFIFAFDKETIKAKTSLNELIKLFTTDFANSELYNTFVGLIDNILNNEKIQTLINNEINARSEVIAQYINAELLKNTVKFVFEDSAFKAILNNFLDKALFNNDGTLTDVSSFEAILKHWLADEENNKVLINYVKQFFNNALDNEQLLSFITSNLYTFLKNNSNLVVNVTEEQFNQLINRVLNDSKTLIDENDLIGAILNVLIQNFQANGFADFSANLSSSFKAVFTSEKIDTLLLNLYKLFVKNNTYTDNKAVIKQIFINFFNENKLFNTKETLKNIIKKLIPIGEQEEQLSNAIDEILGSEKIVNVMIALIDQIFAKNYDEIKDSTNLFTILKANLNNIANTEVYNQFVELVEVVLNNENVKTIVETNLLSKISSTVANSITYTDIKSILLIILKDENVKVLLNQFTNNVILGANSVSDFANFTVLLDKWLKNEDNAAEIKTSATALIKSLLSNASFRKIVNNIVYPILQNFEGITTNITNDEVSSLINDLLDLLLRYENDFNLITNLIGAFVEQLKTNGVSNFSLNGFIETFKNYFDKERIESLVISAFKTTIKQGFITKHKAVIKKLVQNLLRSKYFNSVNDKLATLLVNLASSPEEKENVLQAIKNIYVSDKFNSFIDVFFNKLSELQDQDLDSITKYSDIIKLFLSNFTSGSIYSTLTDLFNSILQNETISNVFKQAMNNKLGNLANYLTYDLAKKLFNLGIQNQSFKVIIDNFLNRTLLDENVDVLQVLKSIDFLIKTWLADEENNKTIINNVKQFALDILTNAELNNEILHSLYNYFKENSNIVTNIDENAFKTALSGVLGNMTDTLQNTTLVNKVVGAIINKLRVDGISGKSLDFGAEIKKALGQNELENFILAVYKLFIKNQTYVNNKQTIKQLITNVFNETQLFNLKNAVAQILSNVFGVDNTNEQLNQIINKVISSEQLMNLILTFADKLLNFDYETVKDIDNIFDLLKINLTDLTSGGIYTKLVELVNFVLQDSQVETFVNEQLITKIPESTRPYITYDKVKYIINFVLKNKNFKTIIDKFVNDAILSATNFDSIKNLNNLLNNWLTVEEHRTAINEPLINFFKDVLKDTQLKTYVQDIIYALLSRYEGMLNNITKAEFSNFFNNLTGLLNSFEEEFGLISKLVQALTQQLANGTNNFNIANLLASIREQFTNETLETSMIKLLKILIKEDHLTNNKEIIKKLITNFLTSALGANTRNSISSILSSITNGQIIVKQFDGFIKNLFKTAEFGKFIDALFETFTSLKDQLDEINTSMDLAKKILENFANSKLYLAFVDFVTTLLNKDQINSLIPLNLVETIKPIIDGVDQNTLNITLKFALTNEPFKALLQHFIDHALLENVNTTEDLLSFKQIIKTYLSNQEYIEFITEKVSAWVKLIITNAPFSDVVSQLVAGTISQYPVIKGDLTTEQIVKLVKDKLVAIDKIDTELGFVKTFVGLALQEAKDNFDNFNFKNVLNNFTNKYFSQANLETTVVKIIKILINNTTANEDKVTVQKLIINTIKYFALTGENAFVNKLWANVPQKIKDISTSFFTLDDLKALTADVIVSQEVNDIISHIFDGLLNNPAEYNSATTFAQLIGIFGSDETRRNQLAADIENLIIKVLNSPQVKAIIAGVFNYNTAKYGVDINSPENRQFVSDLHTELPTILKQLNIIQPIIKGILSNAEKLFTSDSFVGDLFATVINSFNVKDYNLVKIILNSNTLNRNKEVLKDDLGKVITGITSDKTLVKKFLDDFKIAELLKNQGLTDEAALKTLISVFQSPDLKELLILLVNEVIDHSADYASDNRWIDALARFFNSNSATRIQELLKKWLKEILAAKEDLGSTIGLLLAKALTGAGFNITEAHYPSFAKFIQEILKGVANSRIMNDVVNSIFAVLKKINTYPDNSNWFGLLKNAALDGALKFMKNPENGNISMKYIIQNKAVLKEITQNVDGQAMTDVINILFSTSPADRSKGIFQFLFGPLKDSSGSSTSSSSSSSTSSNRPGDTWNAPGFEVGGLGTILNLLQNGLSELIQALLGPVFKNYFTELIAKDKFTSPDAVKQNVSSYQALWRIYTSLLIFAKSNVTQLPFWNNTNTTVEATIYNHWIKTFDAFKNEFKTPIYAKYGQSGKFNALWVAGFNPDYSVNTRYWAGTLKIKNFWGDKSSRSGSLHQTWYASDFVLIYIYYADQYKDVKFNSTKTFTQALMDYLIQGYMPARTSNDVVYNDPNSGGFW